MIKRNWKRWLIAIAVIGFLIWATGIPAMAFFVGVAAGLFQGPRIRDLLRIP